MNAFQRRRRALMMQAAAAPAPVHGTWEDLFAKIADGTYATAYSVGEILPLDLGTEGAVGAAIVAFNADDKADGSGKAKVTFVSKYLLSTNHRWNPARAGSSGAWTVGTGSVGCWKESELRAYVINTIAPLIPSGVSSRIVAVTKYSRGFATDDTAVTADETSDSVWVPSYREIGYGTSTYMESRGVTYPSAFPTGNGGSSKRVKSKVGGSNANFWTRSGGGSSKNGIAVYSTGTNLDQAASNSYAFPIGFCID